MTVLSTSQNDIALAAKALRDGLLVAIPTETVYGLAASAFKPLALARIFEVKKRPFFDPLIVHISKRSQLKKIIDYKVLKSIKGSHNGLSPYLTFKKLTAAFWPGPLTLILPKARELPEIISSGLNTVAVRLPAHTATQKLIKAAGPVAAPSANPFGYLSPTSAKHVERQLGKKIDYIIDGGPSQIGVESTILDLSVSEPCILRPGGIGREEIEALIGPISQIDRSEENPKAPGQLKSHYAPHARLFLYEYGKLFPALLPAEMTTSVDLVFFSRKEAEKIFLKDPPPAGQKVHFLSEHGDLREAASRLFSLLHKLDNLKIKEVYMEKAPPEGLGEAINDRLLKAAAKES